MAALILTGLVAAAAPASADDSQSLYSVDAGKIPDGKGRMVVRFEATVAPAGEGLFSADAGFRVKHPRTRDLKLSLRGPNGETQKLSGRDTKGKHLGRGDCPTSYDPGFKFTWIGDTGQDPLSTGRAPYVGQFYAAQSSPFQGSDPGGTWRLIVEDTKEGRSGRLLCSALELYTKPP